MTNWYDNYHGLFETTRIEILYCTCYTCQPESNQAKINEERQFIEKTQWSLEGYSFHVGYIKTSPSS